MHLRYISIPHLIAEAGGDPWAINQTLQEGRPGQISDLAEAFHAAGRCTTESNKSFEAARRRFESSWNHETGEHPINDSAEVQRVVRSLGAQSLQLPKIGVDLENIAGGLAEAQRTASGQIATLEGQLQRLDDLIGQAVDLENNGNPTPQEKSTVDALIDGCEQDAINDTKATLGQVKSVRHGYSDLLKRSLDTLRTDGYGPVILAGVDAPESPAAPGNPQIPSPDTKPEDVKRWWNLLSKDQQDRLIAQHPPELGNLNGIPVDVRSPVNVAVTNDDLHRVEDTATKYGVSANDVANDPGKYGLSPNAVIRYGNAVQTKKGLGTSAQAKDPWNRHPEVFLLRYQPGAFGGEGAAAIAMGNPDTAANTAVLVKGLGSGVREGTLSNPDGVRLYEESARADPGRPTSVVMWIGYDAPNTVVDPGLYEPNMARTGGRLLAADVNALGVTHHDGVPSHMTVVGHSYGSTTVSDAAAGFGMHADDVVLVGSPGTDLARSAADFHLRPGGHLYVGAASGDAVTWSPGQVHGPGLIGPSLGGLGNDPSEDGYGSTRFKAEVPGYTANPISDHSHYFDDGSESLFSISDVVSGHGDALEHDGMTTYHRGEYGLGGGFDPEAFREATTGHRHAGPAG